MKKYIALKDNLDRIFLLQKTKIKSHFLKIDITLNEKYLLKNILNGSLKKTNIVIEGADGVGKSTLVMEKSFDFSKIVCGHL